MTQMMEAQAQGDRRANEAMIAEAIRMMRSSLELLDRAGAGYTPWACYLSMAVDTVEEQRARDLVSSGSLLLSVDYAVRH